ncbi:MAG TPA: RICIN domain-containing protein, partial [Candidatus Saccharimonadales bacterium]|nr:RICIN domain-containing protein [Candidatus Saccharimonadales bacterium]
MKRKHKRSVWNQKSKTIYAISLSLFAIIFGGIGIYLNRNSFAAAQVIVSPVGNYGYCMDDYQNKNGVAGAPNKVDIFVCNNSAAQNWTYNASNHTVTHNGQCLEVYQNGTANGSKVDLFPCNSGKNQQWTYTGNNTFKGTGSGKCIDDPNGSTTNNTQLQIWTCSGVTQQIW